MILILLIALATPPAGAAMPMCHGDMLEMASGAMPARRAAPPAVDHGCIGCAALADWLAERVTPPLLLPAAPLAPRPIRFALNGGSRPALPPPRIG